MCNGIHEQILQCTNLKVLIKAGFTGMNNPFENDGVDIAQDGC
jgi:hypothetical protein